MISDDTLRALIEIAKKATRGKWTADTGAADGHGACSVSDAHGLTVAYCGGYSVKRGKPCQDDLNGAYIAASCPQVGQQMAEEILRLREALRDARTWLIQVGAGGRELGPYNDDEGAAGVLSDVDAALRDASEERP